MSRSQIDSLIASIPTQDDGEEWRTAAAVVTGFFQEKNLNDVIHFYNLKPDSAGRWWSYYGFDDQNSSKRSFKKTKRNDVEKILASAAGNIMSVSEIADLLEKSTVTVYKIISDNRSWFKKSSRGKYEIINAYEVREKEKQ